jgi:hypothetical protein
MPLRALIFAAIAINIAEAEARTDWASFRSNAVLWCRANCELKRPTTVAGCAAYCECVVSAEEDVLGRDQLRWRDRSSWTPGEQQMLNAMNEVCAQRTLGQ